MKSNDKLKQIDVKSRMCYFFDDITKVEGFDLDSILIDEKSFENILVYNILYKSLIDSKILHIRFDKIDGIIRAIMELDIQYYLEMDNIIPFTTGLDIL